MSGGQSRPGWTAGRAGLGELRFRSRVAPAGRRVPARGALTSAHHAERGELAQKGEKVQAGRVHFTTYSDSQLYMERSSSSPSRACTRAASGTVPPHRRGTQQPLPAAAVARAALRTRSFECTLPVYAPGEQCRCARTEPTPPAAPSVFGAMYVLITSSASDLASVLGTLGIRANLVDESFPKTSVGVETGGPGAEALWRRGNS